MRIKILITVCFFFIFGSLVYAEGPVIIANSSVGVDSLNKAALKNIFLGKTKKWSDGKTVKPSHIKTGDPLNKFLSAYVGKTASQFSSYWKQMIFSGKGTPPKSFASEADLIKYVQATPGAVGHVSAAPEGVKVLTIKAE